MCLSLHALSPGFLWGRGGVNGWAGGGPLDSSPPQGVVGMASLTPKGAPSLMSARHQSFSTPGPPHWRVYYQPSEGLLDRNGILAGGGNLAEYVQKCVRNGLARSNYDQKSTFSTRPGGRGWWQCHGLQQPPNNDRRVPHDHPRLVPPLRPAAAHADHEDRHVTARQARPW